MLRTGSSNKLDIICLFFSCFKDCWCCLCLLHVKKDAVRSGKEDELDHQRCGTPQEEQLSKLELFGLQKRV